VGAERLADADAVSELILRLGQSDLVEAEFGAGVVSGEIEAPWPHITVGPSGAGDLRGMVGGSMVTGVLLEFVSPLDGTVGPAALWKKAMKVIAEVCGYGEDTAEQDPVRPVICYVQPAGYLTEQPLASGQYRVSQAVMVTIAPPQS
jgi:hypothetical protein